MLDVVEADSDGFGSFLDGLSRKKKSKMKKRFSDEQIKSLEKIFECESKLEPRKKLQLAKDLGLQPRQVAVWFQNKRARWKSKQLERDYDVLKEEYDSLSSRFDLLNKENQSLVLQLKKLHKQMQKNGVEDARSGSMGENFDNLNSSSHEYTPSGLAMAASDDDHSIKAEYFGMEDERLVAEMVEQVDGSLTSTTENWEDLDSDPLLDQSTVTDDGNQWWDFWS